MMGERLPDSESAKSERLTHDGVRSLGSGSRSSDARLIIGLAVIHHLSICGPLLIDRYPIEEVDSWGVEN